jgi:hypothetical protein
LFRRYVVVLNFPARELRLYEPRSYRPDPSAAVLPLAFHRRMPFATATVGGLGGSHFEGKFCIDSGHNGGLVLSSAFVQSHRLLEAAGSLKLDGGSDVAGTATQRKSGQVPFVRLGPLTLPRPETLFEAHPTLHPRKQAGVIGTGMLRRFDVTFDYPHRRLYLKPNADFSLAFTQRWTGSICRLAQNSIHLRISGAEITASAPQYDRFQIVKLLPDSPAARTGLRAGDWILAFNNMPLATFSMEQWLDLSAQSGRNVQVQFQRADQTLVRPLLLDWECYEEKSTQPVSP